MQDLLIPTTNIMFWTWITFGLLVLALGKWGWKPIIQALDTRINKIKSDLEHAENNRVHSDKLIAEQKEILSQARSEAEKILNKAKQEAAGAKEEVLDAARKEAQEVAKRATAEIENAKNRALEELKGEVGQLSVDIAGKIIKKSLSAKDHEDLVMTSLKEYQNLKG
jgi:F-type H+-transporting ATPase subunit b